MLPITDKLLFKISDRQIHFQERLSDNFISGKHSCLPLSNNEAKSNLLAGNVLKDKVYKYLKNGQIRTKIKKIRNIEDFNNTITGYQFREKAQTSHDKYNTKGQNQEFLFSKQVKNIEQKEAKRKLGTDHRSRKYKMLEGHLKQIIKRSQNKKANKSSVNQLHLIKHLTIDFDAQLNNQDQQSNQQQKNHLKAIKQQKDKTSRGNPSKKIQKYLDYIENQPIKRVQNIINSEQHINLKAIPQKIIVNCQNNSYRRYSSLAKKKKQNSKCLTSFNASNEQNKKQDKSQECALLSPKQPFIFIQKAKIECLTTFQNKTKTTKQKPINQLCLEISEQMISKQLMSPEIRRLQPNPFYTISQKSKNSKKNRHASLRKTIAKKLRPDYQTFDKLSSTDQPLEGWHNQKDSYFKQSKIFQI